MPTGARLREYRRKRRFGRTPEPRGSPPRPRRRHFRAIARGRARPRGWRPARLSFIVQKHLSRRLHFDFRLEWEGALKSWAVPKGPSLVTGEKRLAVQVEDHPLEYGRFEGEIPSGHYGAGTVTLWDRGTWEPEGDAAQGLRRGRLKFRLEGGKLRGTWSLVAMRGGKDWLLIREGSGTAALPERAEPQLATLVSAVPEGPGWLHEVKYDGYRILARVHEGRARLLTRRGNDWTGTFPVIAQACSGLPAREALLDGEIVALDEKGRSSFSALQDALKSGRAGRLVYFVFDLLHLEGEDLRPKPLRERKEALRRLLGKVRAGPVRPAEHVEGGGERMFRRACALGLEGVVSKRAEAPYRSGRGTDWTKAKCVDSGEFVVCGFSAPRGSRKEFGALLLGVRDRGRLRYVGRVGAGFSLRNLRELRARLAPLEAGRSPFPEEPPRSRDARWVRPELVAQVEFRGWTRDGILRQPSFQGLRGDKPAEEAVVERAQPPPAPTRLTHPEKVLFPKAGLTKGGLADYYRKAARLLLPHVARRPLALVRCPEGSAKPCFFQKRAGPSLPAAVRSSEEFLYIEDLEGLLALVQVGALELHPWGSTADDPERPDRVTFDLDPGEGVPWKDVAAAAREMRGRLAALRLPAFLKTTGGKGLHVVVPLTREHGWPEVKAFAKAFAELMAADAPELYVTKAAKSLRRGRIFLDWLRNDRGATAVAPYSTRARPDAPVAAPLAWEELAPSLKSDRFTVKSMLRRLASRADPWRGFERARRRLPRP